VSRIAIVEPIAAAASTRPRAVRAARAIGRVGVDRTVGLLPLFEHRLRARRWRAARRLRRVEDELVGSLSRTVPSLPAAEVTTVIPSHRRPASLALAVESALAQSVTDHHVIVVHDGPGLERLPENPRLTAIALPKNIGTAGVVRNVGIRLSSSRLVAFLDDDNTWRPDHLERALEAHAAGAELSYSMLERVTADGDIVDVLGEPFDRRAMKERSLVDTNVIVVRRRPDVMFSRIPRRRGDFPLEDWELVWRLSRRLRIVHVPHITVRYVRHGGSRYSEWGNDDEPSPFDRT
jgi:glycosyltransferase involved in cell wall biosynthesis